MTQSKPRVARDAGRSVSREPTNPATLPTLGREPIPFCDSPTPRSGAGRT